MPEQRNGKVFGVDAAHFEALALEIFRYQYAHNPTYSAYCNALRIVPAGVNRLTDIPFLPIRFFKSGELKSGEFTPALVFESSGTTGTVNSRHLVRDTTLYEESIYRGFERVYGPVSDYSVLGLLPSYLERSNSSLVWMVEKLIQRSGQESSGFYLYEFEKLKGLLQQLENQGQKTLLIGVTFALLDFAQQFPIQLSHTIVMETGGMKGRREEMVRPQVHEILKKSFGLAQVHSEYSMTELLSQAYSTGEGIFTNPPWMRLLVRDDEDPLTVRESGRGALNIIDLANVHSCSFIATDDAGIVHANGSFEVMGRMDGSDLRGCSLLTVPNS